MGSLQLWLGGTDSRDLGPTRSTRTSKAADIYEIHLLTPCIGHRQSTSAGPGLPVLINTEYNPGHQYVATHLALPGQPYVWILLSRRRRE